MAKPKLPKATLSIYHDHSFTLSTSSSGLEAAPASVAELGAIIPGTTHGVAVHSGRATEDGKWHVGRYDSFNTARDVHDWAIWIGVDLRLDGDQLAFPLDPRMTERDIEGASEAYLNEAGTAWLFRHSRAGIHHDTLHRARPVRGAHRP